MLLVFIRAPIVVNGLFVSAFPLFPVLHRMPPLPFRYVGPPVGHNRTGGRPKNHGSSPKGSQQQHGATPCAARQAGNRPERAKAAGPVHVLWPVMENCPGRKGEGPPGKKKAFRACHRVFSKKQAMVCYGWHKQGSQAFALSGQ
jgi:hypothetical protein